MQESIVEQQTRERTQYPAYPGFNHIILVYQSGHWGNKKIGEQNVNPEGGEMTSKTHHITTAAPPPPRVPPPTVPPTPRFGINVYYY